MHEVEEYRSRVGCGDRAREEGASAEARRGGRQLKILPDRIADAGTERDRDRHEQAGTGGILTAQIAPGTKPVSKPTRQQRAEQHAQDDSETTRLPVRTPQQTLRQLRGEAGPRQVQNARIALSHTVGRGANASVIILTS